MLRAAAFRCLIVAALIGVSRAYTPKGFLKCATS